MNKLLVIALLALLYTNLSFGENMLDSLKRQYQQQKELNDKTLTALKIASKLRNVDNEKSKLYVDRAINHSISDGNQTNLAHAYELKGSILTGMGQTKDALELLFGAINIYESLDSTKLISTCYNTIGNAYLDLDDIEKCTKYYNLSYDYAIQTQDTAVIAVPLVGLGIAHSEIGEYQPALKYSLKAAEMFDKIKRLDAYCISMANAASYAFECSTPEHADSLLDLAKEAAKKIESKYFKGEIMLMESEWMSEKGEIDKAISLAESGIQLMNEIDARSNTMTALGYLSSYYEQSGNYLKALSALKKHITLKDSLNEQNKTEIVEELNTKYESAEKEKLINELNAQSELQTLENDKNKLILYIVVGCSLLLFGVLIFALVANFQKKKANALLSTQKAIIQEKNNEILDSIKYAKRIQNAIIPSAEAIAKNLNESFVLYQPKDIVAGDFYWMEVIGDTVLLAVADCTGHGVPGAMVSVVCHNALNRSVREFKLTSPSKILDKTRELVVEAFSENQAGVKDGMDITLCAWHKKDNSIEWAGANNPLYLIRANNSSEIEIVNPDKQPIGNYETSLLYTNHKLKLTKGDIFYLFSDGYMDQFGGENGKKFKYSNFRNLLLKINKTPMPKQGEALVNTFQNWKGELEQLDDVCVIGVRVT
ncbi:MAG: SpoIIE family protein phosphatase [Crocinitomicaceae bacterium]